MGKFDSDPDEILDKSLLFDLKKQAKIKYLIQYTKKIPDKYYIYYIEHREGMNAFRLRKYSKKAEKDELVTMLETVNTTIKRSISKSKLSQLK